MAGNPAEIDWDTLKHDAAAETRVALDHLERLAAATAAREGHASRADPVPAASRVALAIAVLATIRVVFAVAASMLLDVAAPTTVPLWIMSGASLLFVAGGIVLWVGGERDWRARHLGLAYLAVGGAFVDSHLIEIGTVGPSSIAFAAVTLRALPVEAFVSYFVLAFLEVFPRVTPDTPAQRWVTRLKWVALGIGIVLALISAATWLGTSVLGADETPPALRSLLPAATGRNIFWLAILSVLVPAPVLAILKARHSRGEERQRARLLLAGVSVALGPFTVLLIAAALSGWFVQPARARAAAFVVYPALVTLPATTAYAVLTRGALDVRVLVRNAAHYALARWVLMAFTVIPLLVTVTLAYDYRTETLESLLGMPFARGLLLTAAAATVLATARSRVLGAIDRVFLRSVVDAETLVASVAESARRLPTAHDVAACVTASLEHSFAVERATVLALTARHDAFEPLGGPLPTLTAASALADLVSAGNDVLTTDTDSSLIGLLPEDDRGWLAASRVEALVPLLGRGDRLIGLVALGHRRGEWSYGPRDRGTLKAVAAAVAPVLERHLEARAQTGSEASAPLFVCAECGVIHSPDTARCPCGGPIEGSVIPRVVGGKYHVTRCLGRGAMGVVYEARDVGLERLVAVKTLPHLSYHEGERLVQEARRMTRVTHQNLAYVIGLETFNGMPLVVMEYLPGRTLRDRLSRGPLPLGELRRIGSALCDALERLHHAGLLHRDIKPGNIGFDSDGTPKLLDFGLALPIESEHVQGVTLAGTPLYLPPEAWSEPADEHVDLWGLSITLCEAWLGAHPMAGATAQALEAGGAAAARHAFTARTDVDATAATVFGRALAPDPAERFPDAAALRAALSTLLHTEQTR